MRPLSFRPKRSEVENTPCGDAGGWAAGWDHDPGRSDETSERLGRARVKSLTILRSKMRDVSTAVDMIKKAGRRSNFLYVMWRGGKDEIAGI